MRGGKLWQTFSTPTSKKNSVQEALLSTRPPEANSTLEVKKVEIRGWH
jgi:hypothetical protein